MIVSYIYSSLTTQGKTIWSIVYSLKIKRFLKEVTLLSQDFIKDPDTSISKLLENSDNEVVSFERFKVGEGIEVSSKDFAEEVAEQLNKDG